MCEATFCRSTLFSPEMKREVPCPDDECHAIGLRVKVGLVQEGEGALPHRHVLRPGVDVPVSYWISLSAFLY
jgi:hypothetical protein